MMYDIFHKEKKNLYRFHTFEVTVFFTRTFDPKIALEKLKTNLLYSEEKYITLHLRNVTIRLVRKPIDFMILYKVG